MYMLLSMHVLLMRRAVMLTGSLQNQGTRVIRTFHKVEPLKHTLETIDLIILGGYFPTQLKALP